MVDQPNTYQLRQGSVFDDADTTASDWSVCEFGFNAGAMIWRIPEGYQHLDTKYGVAADDGTSSTTCQICGHNIVRRCYIKSDRIKAVLRVGTECIETYVDAVTPEQRDRWELAKLAMLLPATAARCAKVMESKGFSYRRALVAVRAWNRAEKAYKKNYPQPTPEDEAAHQRLRNQYWASYHVPGGDRRKLWIWWKQVSLQHYAKPGTTLAQEWKTAQSAAIRTAVEKALIKDTKSV